MKEFTSAFWRKTAAAAIALTIVAGGAPAQVFPEVFADTAITASADAKSDSAFPSLYDTFNNGGTVKLGENLTAKNYATMYVTGNATLDLNGYYVKAKDKTINSGTVITVKAGAKLTVTDSSSGKSGMIFGAGNGCGISVEKGGELVLDAGRITGNNAAASSQEHCAGGVYVAGTFTMNGGSIDNNTYSGSGTTNIPYGGGVHVHGGTFTMNGGTISENSATENSNGLSFGGGVAVREKGKFIMNGGTISNNNAVQAGGVGITLESTADITDATIKENITETNDNPGSGICCLNGTANLKNVTITGNRNMQYGKKVSVAGLGAGVIMGEGGNVNLAGKVIIKDNYLDFQHDTDENKNATFESNLTFADNQTIGIFGAITSGSDIHFESLSGLDPMTDGWKQYMTGVSPRTYFTYDDLTNQEYYVTLNENSEVRVTSYDTDAVQSVTKYGLSATLSGETQESTVDIVDFDGNPLASSAEGYWVYARVTPKKGYHVKNAYYIKSGSTTKVDLNEYEDNLYRFIMPDGAVTVYIELEADVVSEATFVGNSVSIDGDLGLNYYFLLPETQTDAKMKFTCSFDGKKKEVMAAPLAVETATGLRYFYKCPVAAKDMASDIKAELLDAQNNVLWSKDSYSVKAYAEDYLKDTSVDNGASEPLVKAMLNYGAYCQQYFGYNTGSLANATTFMTDAERNVSDLTSFGSSFKANNTLPAGVSSGAILTLDDLISLKVIFFGADKVEYAGGNIDETVTISDTDDGPAITFGGIRYWNLEKEFEIKVTRGSTTTTVKYSPKYFCHNVIDLGSGKPALKPAMQALCKLYNTIQTYLAT